MIRSFFKPEEISFFFPNHQLDELRERIADSIDTEKISLFSNPKSRSNNYIFGKVSKRQLLLKVRLAIPVWPFYQGVYYYNGELEETEGGVMMKGRYALLPTVKVMFFLWFCFLAVGGVVTVGLLLAQVSGVIQSTADGGITFTAIAVVFLLLVIIGRFIVSLLKTFDRPLREKLFSYFNQINGIRLD